MLIIDQLLLCADLGPQARVDHVKANVALAAGMIRHGISVRTRFYISRAMDTGLERTLGEPGLALYFNGEIFDASGCRGWKSIERSAKARLDAAFDAMSITMNGFPGVNARDYEFRILPHPKPAYYHSVLETVDESWILRAEMAAGVAIIPRPNWRDRSRET